MRPIGILELQPIYDSRQSFYRKAWTQTQGKTLNLISYETKVLSYDTKKHILNLNSVAISSQTTLRHVREFLLQQSITPNNIIVNGKYLKDFSKKSLQLLVDRKIIVFRNKKLIKERE